MRTKGIVKGLASPSPTTLLNLHNDAVVNIQGLKGCKNLNSENIARQASAHPLLVYPERDGFSD